MKNVYFVQVDVAADADSKYAYLPYTAGVLVSSAWSRENIKNNYAFKGFAFLRENPSDVLERMEEPSVVAFSNYCWNTEYNKILSKKIKEKFPDCVIIFGGHNVPETDEFLREYPFIDILTFGEGEIVFGNTLEALLDNSLDSVLSIAFRKDGEIVITEKAQPSDSLEFPSPYLDGWFDDVIKEHPNMGFNAILETSRGCPNRCAYCDWGLLNSKVRLAPMQRVLDEIKWMSDHHIAFIWGADSNFGMFDRDIDIAKALAEVKKKNGYPERMRMNYSKTNYKNVFEIIKIFKECDFDRLGATLSFQSMSPVVLENINRKNMSDSFFEKMIAVYNENYMKTYSELILGLPGETYESFTKGIAKVFDIGQHFAFDAYNCHLLPNSIMGQPSFVKKYDIKTTRCEIVRVHAPSSELEITEYSNIITSTNTLSSQDWVKANMFVYITKAMHSYGLLRIFAFYNRIVNHIPYDEFYNKLMDYCENEALERIKEVYSHVLRHIEEKLSGKEKTHMYMDFSKDLIWDGCELMTLVALKTKQQFYDDITPFLKKFKYEDGAFEALMEYQKAVLRSPGDVGETIILDYDVRSFEHNVYINKAERLEKIKTEIKLTDTEPCYDWPTFAKYVVWYGHLGWKSYKDDIEIVKYYKD